MPAFENGNGGLDMRVVYNKGGKKNGYHGRPEMDFDRPSDWDNDESEEDEVFMQGSSLDHDRAARPLMFPRTRAKNRLGYGRCARFKHVFNAVCCFIFLVLSLGSLMGLVVYFVNKHNANHLNATLLETSLNVGLFVPETPIYKFVKERKSPVFSDVIGCDNVHVEDVWTIGFPKLLTESAFRLLDVNQDGDLDVIMGFATGNGARII